MNEEILQDVRVIVARTEVKVDGLVASSQDHENRLRLLEARPAALTAAKLWTTVVTGSSTVAALAGLVALLLAKKNGA